MRSARLGVAVVALTLGWLLVHAPPASACSCAGPEPDPAGAVAAADAAFVGTLVAIDDPDGNGFSVSSGRRVFNRFRVEGVAKGDIGTTVVVAAAAEGASCGLGVPFGHRAGLLLIREDDGWRSGLCSKVDPDALAAISVPPRAGAGDGDLVPAPPTTDPPPDGRLVLNLGLALVLGGLAVVWTARMNRANRAKD